MKSQQHILKNKRIAVIGAGIVGLAVAYHLYKAGASVVVLDRDPAGDKASFGNAGGIASTEVLPPSSPGVLLKAPGWLIDPLGPLSIRPASALRLIPWLVRFAKASRLDKTVEISKSISAINGRIYDDLLPMLDDLGLREQIHRSGALTAYETKKAFDDDAMDRNLKSRYGIEFRILGAAEIHDIEPHLSEKIRIATLVPGWSQINDPKQLVDDIRMTLSSRGVEIRAGTVVSLLDAGHSVNIYLEDGRHVTANAAVVAAGAWSGIITEKLGERVLLESERGYNTTLPDPGITINREIIFAERKFVASPLSCGLRIGGAAEFGGLHAKANNRRCENLLTLAKNYLPELRTDGGIAWNGHRPSTPDGLPVIGPSTIHRNVFYAFGHGRLGLTQAATTGRLIADIVAAVEPPIDISPYSISRFN